MSEQRHLYQRIRSRIVAMILEDGLRDGDQLPSVRALASEMHANPLTVARAYSILQDTGIIEARRGIGYFLTAGGKARLKESERVKFMMDEWPAITRKMKMLDLDPALLLRSALDASASGK